MGQSFLFSAPDKSAPASHRLLPLLCAGQGGEEIYLSVKEMSTCSLRLRIEDALQDSWRRLTAPRPGSFQSRPRHRSFSHERRPKPREERRSSSHSLDLEPSSPQRVQTATIHKTQSLTKMATLSLKISLEGGKVVKTIQFDPSTTVYDACRIIREKILEANANDPKEYGLFLASEEDNKKGIWLEASRSLDYYMLRNGDLLEYNKKTRNLRVRMLDGTVKTLLVDDSQIVANLMVVICTKIGITNYDEYGLVREEQKEEADPCEKPNYGTLTLKRRHQEKERDAKMEQLRKKLRTDDEGEDFFLQVSDVCPI
ncbi:jg10318 [Pararge aegeria aegeria]|uniref:Jg10318 protein n=1 Tax=Pararge aegeria aegeria TaxID=348720 RepID=A0A8S4RYA3_9NEOP|nr:jg10318 [Pararge aegeria aegeria]